jgi:hypothetical protein
MITMCCNWCGMSISDVGYTVLPVSASTNGPSLGRLITEHLHFDCLPKWVEYMRGGAPPPIDKRRIENRGT